jgi:hypothetical protein
MKKAFLTAAVAAVALGANAQQTRYGFELGAHLGNLVQELPDPTNPNGTTTLSKDHIDGRPNLGLRAGLVADFGLSDNFSIQPGLFFVMKGVRNEIEVSSETGGVTTRFESQNKLNLNYIEVPLNIQYKTREDGTGFFVGAGPYFGYAISGKTNSQSTFEQTGGGSSFKLETDEDRELSFGDNADDDYKNLDVGVGLNIGYMLPMGAFVRGYGQYSFSNIIPVPESKYETKNYGFGITVGYMFGGKRGAGPKDDPTSATD